DVAGDAADVLGVAAAGMPGLAEWFPSDVDAMALDDLAVPATSRVGLIPAGNSAVGGAGTRWSELARWCADREGIAVVDAGTGAPPDELCAEAGAVLLVIRPCYLALRRARRLRTVPSGVVVVSEPGRALRSGDVASTIGVPVVARVHVDPAVARAVDAGLLAAAVPRRLARELRPALGALR
ncbi:MAG: hypothetical protein M3337_01385, partial [Actinomycetota bacterium]|nr:hypothetical protein [Actinomycetota bacterium]